MKIEKSPTIRGEEGGIHPYALMMQSLSISIAKLWCENFNDFFQLEYVTELNFHVLFKILI